MRNAVYIKDMQRNERSFLRSGGDVRLSLQLNTRTAVGHVDSMTYMCTLLDRNDITWYTTLQKHHSLLYLTGTTIHCAADSVSLIVSSSISKNELGYARRVVRVLRNLTELLFDSANP